MSKKFFALVAALCMIVVMAMPAMAVEELNPDDFDMEYYSQFKDAGISINVYNWGEYISIGEDGLLDVNQAFTDLTGIKVNYTTFDTNEALYAKLKSGGTNYDVIIPSDYMIARMIEEDMLEKLDYSNIPASKNIMERFLNQSYDPTGEYSIPYTWGTVGIIYNTTMVDKEVNSWDILWDEDYAGNILMFSNPRDAFGIAQKKLGYSLNTQDEEELRKCAEELKAQKPVVQAYVMDQIFDKLGGGEAAIGPYYAGDAITMIDDNPDLAFVVPEEGTNIFVDAICIPKGSTQKKAAEMYINFLCEGIVAADNITYIGYSSPNQAAFDLLDEEIRNNPIIYPPDEILDRSEQFLNLSAETNRLMDQLWTDILTESDTVNTWVMPITLAVLVVLAVILVALRLRKKKREQNY